MSSSYSSNKHNFPAPFTGRRYYTPKEVRQHNTANDCWVSFFYVVYDLTELIQKNYSALVDPLIKRAGTDISDWFDVNTRDPKVCIVDGTNYQGYFCVDGHYLHVPPNFPNSTQDYHYDTPWWKDSKLMIGNLTKKVRKVKIVNTLVNQSDTIEVCAEETINEIMDRYREYNQHADSYTWKRLKRVLKMEDTLEENGIIDESEEYFSLDLDPDFYIPAIHLYFNDDLTEA